MLAAVLLIVIQRAAFNNFYHFISFLVIIGIMKQSFKFVISLLFIPLFFYACGGGERHSFSAAAPQIYAEPVSMDYIPLFYTGSNTSWEGTGYTGTTDRLSGSRNNEFIPSQQYSSGDFIQDRLLTKEAFLSIRVFSLYFFEEDIMDLMQPYRAWLSSTIILENQHTYTIRVPSDLYDAMLSELSDLGTVLRRTETAEDVTSRYYDLESRLETQNELLRTYRSYLARAQNIDEIMSVERHIAELQREIDFIGNQFRNLSGRIEYSTITLQVHGGSPFFNRPSMGDRMDELFSSFGDIISSAFVFLIGAIIYGVPAILALIIFYWIFFGRVGLIRKLWRLASGRKK